jgi:hypothetical protein
VYAHADRVAAKARAGQDARRFSSSHSLKPYLPTFDRQSFNCPENALSWWFLTAIASGTDAIPVDPPAGPDREAFTQPASKVGLGRDRSVRPGWSVTHEEWAQFRAGERSFWHPYEWSRE